MPRGRPKKPDTIKRLEGNPGGRPLNDAAPVPVGELEMPEYVLGYAESVWDQIVSSMPDGLYTRADSIVLAAFCVAVSQYKDATQILMSDGLTYINDNGDIKSHPALVAQTKALATMNTLGSKLGLDPTARASLKMPVKAKPESSFADLIGGAKKGA